MAVGSKFADTLIRVGLGSEKSLAKCVTKSMEWRVFGRRISHPVQTNERFAVYKSMTADQKAEMKRGAGWYIGGPTRDGRRNKANIVQRDILTFDVDFADEALLEEVELGLNPICEWEFFWHTSRSHAPDKPKFRLILLPEDPVAPEMYDAVIRVLALTFDSSMEAVDPVSFRLAQMMYWPSHSKDQEFKWGHNPGKLVSAETVLKRWGGEWRNFAALPRSPHEKRMHQSAGKAEDPTAKGGVIGAFCRTYSIEQVIDEFLSDKFALGDCSQGETRYTYVGSSTSSGAKVYDDGKFLYSHHATDPGSERNLNAFDLVRVHLFESDEENASLEDSTDPTKLDSYKRMVEFAKADKKVRGTLAEESVDHDAMVMDALDDISDAEEGEAEDLLAGTDAEEEEDVLGGGPKENPGKRRPPLIGKHQKPTTPENWMSSEMEIDLQGNYVNSITNLTAVLTYAPQFAGKFAYNEFAQSLRQLRPVKSKKLRLLKPRPIQDPSMGDKLENYHSDQVRLILEAERGSGKIGWGFRSVAERNVDAALRSAAEHYRFNPVKELLERQWKGWAGERGLAERLWIEVTGAPDNAYTRETARLWLIASIARTYHPGHKFDFMPILIGEQGQGKSTFGKKLFGESFFSRLTADFVKKPTDAVEQMMGRRGLEWGEIAHIRRTEVDESKAFLDQTEDEVRLAYDRRTGVFKRTCVFLGSTNEMEFLKDETGNRRFWPLMTTLEKFRFDWLEQNLDQIWGEAMQLWWEMCQEHDYAYLPLFLQGEPARIALEAQTRHKEETLEEQESVTIARWLRRELPLSALEGAGEDFDSAVGEPLVIRAVTTTQEVGVEALGMLPERARTSKTIAKAMRFVPGWERSGAAPIYHPKYGMGRFWKLANCTADEFERGYRVVGRVNPALEDEDDNLL